MTHPIPRATILAPLLFAAGCARLFPGAERGSAPTAAPQVTTAVADASPAPTHAAPQSTPVPEGDVARLLANPPAAGEVVEIDAFTGFDPGVPGRVDRPRVGGASGYPCSGAISNDNWLTDRPYRFIVNFGDVTQRNNPLPAEAAWLVPARPSTAADLTRVQRLPFHARLRGHLGDAGYASCPIADRIFVIDEIVRDYGDPLPGSTDPDARPQAAADWPRFTSQQFGFSFAYPPNWQADEDPAGDVTFSLPNRSDVTMQLKVRAGETTQLDATDPWLSVTPEAVHSIGSGGWSGGWGQADPSRGDMAGVAPLSGFKAACHGATTACIRQVLNFDGRSYQFAIDFPIGFDVPQDELWLYSAVVNSFRVPNQPTKTPAPSETSTPTAPGYP